MGYCDLGTSYASCAFCSDSSPSTLVCGSTNFGTYVAGSVTNSCPGSFPGGNPVPASSSNSCFAGSEALTLESGRTVTMEEVQVGDRVLVASKEDLSRTYYSPVIVVPHPLNSEKASFVRLTTESGRDIKMTADHLVMAGACGATPSLLQAGSLPMGACLHTVTGQDAIKSIVILPESTGVYTVVTASASDLLIVNGVIASPFASNHLIANSFYNIHRMVHYFAPAVASHSVVAKVLCAFGDIVVSLSR